MGRRSRGTGGGGRRRGRNRKRPCASFLALGSLLFGRGPGAPHHGGKVGLWPKRKVVLLILGRLYLPGNYLQFLQNSGIWWFQCYLFSIFFFFHVLVYMLVQSWGKLPASWLLWTRPLRQANFQEASTSVVLRRHCCLVSGPYRAGARLNATHLIGSFLDPLWCHRETREGASLCLRTLWLSEECRHYWWPFCPHDNLLKV